METEEGAQELRAKDEAKIGSCLVCKGKREYQRRLPLGALSWLSDRLQECKDFQALNPHQRAGVILAHVQAVVRRTTAWTDLQAYRPRVIQDQGGCVVCLSWGHHKFRCNMVQ